MRIHRYDDYGDERIKHDWLHEFGADLVRNANELDYLKQYLNSFHKNKFSSVEEKLADIKERVGFDLAQKISQEVNGDIIAEASCGCGGGCCSIKTASHSREDVKHMRNILEYIADMIKHEPHLTPAVVISRCREEPGLRFNNLAIDIGKLNKYINYHIDKYGFNKVDELVHYAPIESDIVDSYDERNSEYYNHSKPNFY